MITEIENNRIGLLRWFTLFIQIVIGSASGFVYCLTIYLGPLNEAHGWDINKIIIAFTLSMVVGTPAIIIGGAIREKVGSRSCIIASGALYGTATAVSGIVSSVWAFVVLQGIIGPFFMFLIYIAQMSNIGELFPDKRGLAIGLLTAGTAFGAGICAPVAEFFISHYSVTASIVIQGIGYGLIIVVLGFFVINAPGNYKPAGWVDSKEEELAENVERVDSAVGWRTLIKLPSAYALILTFIFINIIGNMLASNLSLMAQDALRVDPAKAALLVSVFTMAGGVGGIALGFAADKFGAFKVVICGTIINAAALLSATFIGLHFFTLFTVLMVVLGFTYNGFVTLVVVITMNAYGEKHFGTNYGILGIGVVLSSLIGPQLAVSVSVAHAFIFSAVFSFLGALTAIFAQRSINKYFGRKVVS